jgi:anthranilate phosphoribosyltransferase
MKYVQPIRKALGFRTVFNILGPLANPANVGIQIIGAARPYLLPIMAEALKLLGVSRAMVVHGEGIDEFTTCGPTDICELRAGEISRHTIDYSDYGLARASLNDLAGGTLADNAALTRDILANKVAGPRLEVVLLNAAAVLMVAGQAAGFAEGIVAARESIADGRAAKALDKLVTISNQ